MPIFEYSQKEIEYLKKKDKKLGAAIDRIGMIERTIIPDLFTALVRNIISQQISSQAAATVWKRFQDYFRAIDPLVINETEIEEIQQIGMSMRKAGYIKSIAREVTEGNFDLSELYLMPDHEIIKKLMALPGIGRWTAEMLMIFSMQRPDVVSWDDLAIQRGMKNLYNLKSLSRPQFDKYRKRYSPFGSVASLYLWEVSREDMP